MSRAKTVPVPCNIIEIMCEVGEEPNPPYECNSSETLYSVKRDGQPVGNVCSDHIHLIDSSEEPFKYGFAVWQQG